MWKKYSKSERRDYGRVANGKLTQEQETIARLYQLGTREARLLCASWRQYGKLTFDQWKRARYLIRSSVPTGGN